jgi:hypothetical protein
MVSGAQEGEKDSSGDIRLERTDHPAPCPNQTGGGEECGSGIEDLAGVIRLSLQAVFPEFNRWLGAIPDPRREHPSKLYPLSLEFWLVMLMFVNQAGSRRQHDQDCKTPAFLKNLALLAGVDEIPDRVPTAEAADDLLQKLDPRHIQRLRWQMVHALIRSKRLDSCRWNGYWRLAVDATGVYSSAHRHCPYCQTRRCSKTDVTTYYHNVLEFKLVSSEGLAISIFSEFIVNRDGEAKQDSELKAFYRAAPLLKQEWPRLRPSSHRPVEMAQETGRQRWKIENQGFNTQKKGGYNLEHGYGVTGHAWKNYYLIIQIVHMIMQLVLRTDAIHKLPSRRERENRGSPPPIRRLFGSIKNFIKRLGEAFRYSPPTWENIAELGPFQLRFLDSG